MITLTVKQVLDEFCDRINQPRETAYVGATTPAAYQYVSLFKHIGSQLLDYDSGWWQLKRVYAFTSTANEANYQLPGDFHRLLKGTQWDTSNQIPFAGPLTNERLAFREYGVNIATPFAGWQVNGAQGYIFETTAYDTKRSSGYFQISPAPGDSSTEYVIAYTSGNYVWPTDWATGQTYAQGALVSGVNNIYVCSTAITTSDTRPDAVSGTDADDDGFWTVSHEPYQITADNDYVLLDPELFVEGMRWAYFEAKEKFLAAERLEKKWRAKVKAAMGRQQGAVLTNAGIDPTANWQWPVTPDSSWSGTGGT